jgi:CRISPR-associated protein Cas2
VRRRYLVCYDIREPRRLRDTHRVVSAFGEFLQYSLYVCDLSGSERIRMMDKLHEVIDHRVDSVVVFDLGLAEPGTSARIVHTLGPGLRLPEGGGTIV